MGTITFMQLIGAGLLSLPFIALGVYIVKEGGWAALFQIFGAVALVYGCVTAGVILLMHGG